MMDKEVWKKKRAKDITKVFDALDEVCEACMCGNDEYQDTECPFCKVNDYGYFECLREAMREYYCLGMCKLSQEYNYDAYEEAKLK